MIKNYLFSLIEASYDQNSHNILQMLERDPQANLLDLGCDNGEWTMKLAKKIQTKNVSGIEIVKERADKAEKLGIRTFQENLNGKFSFGDATFDVVHSNQVIEHLHDTDSFISEIWRILKPGGFAIVSTENLASWHNIFALLLGFQPFSMSNFSTKGVIGNPFALWNDRAISEPESGQHNLSWQHNRLFSYFALKDIFSKHGFQVEKVQTSGYYPLWGWLSRIDPVHGHWITIKVRKRKIL